MAYDDEQWADLFKDWSDFFKKFMKDATAEDFVTKFKEEAQEFWEKPSLEEMSDVFATMLAWAIEVHGGVEHAMNLFFLASEAKLEKNLRRKWERMPDGTYHHIKEPS